jgi:hypothetical protein
VLSLSQLAYGRLHRWFLLAPTNQVTQLAKSKLSPFEYGDVEISGEMRAFLRILDLEEHVRKHMAGFWSRGELVIRSNTAAGELVFTLLVDKRGKSTKLVLVSWNVRNPHSYASCSLLAEVEGGEDRAAVLAVFGPLLDQAQKMEEKGVDWTFSINDLATLSLELCRHEVRLLLIRATSLGNWVPSTSRVANGYPKDMPGPYKFHLAVVEMPLFAEQYFTVGLAAEHVVEVMHKRINQLNHVYCAIANKSHRMAVSATQTWMESDQNIGNFDASKALYR